MFQFQLSRDTLIHLACLAAWKMEILDLDSTNYSASVQKLHDEFTSRLPEFRRDGIKAKLFAQPFELKVDDSPDDCLIEQIELQADMDPKRRYSEIAWCISTRSLQMESFPICPVMREKLHPLCHHLLL